ncbi:UNVERIFIED_CONTAM: dnaQ [Trichonephila clavipes]
MQRRSTNLNLKKLTNVLDVSRSKEDVVENIESYIDSNDENSIKVTYEQILKKNKDFSISHFIEGSSIAFELIIKYFNQGNLSQLKPLLDKDLYDNFAEKIKHRKEVHESIIVSIVSQKILEIKLSKLTSLRTMKEISYQTQAGCLFLLTIKRQITIRQMTKLTMESKLREIVLDTETTGLDTGSGHRIIEIGCVELINRIPTGKVFHRYLNPERDIPYHSFKIHGISEEFLEDKPLFSDVALEFLDFISNDILVIHNAEFDVKFLNMELSKLNAGLISSDRVLDTLPLARKKFVGSPASLNALCKRFDISLENRELHGALVDAQLLAKVYVELTGGLQTFLFDNECNQDSNSTFVQHKVRNLTPREHSPNSEEIDEHKKLLDKINNTLWNKYIE